MIQASSVLSRQDGRALLKKSTRKALVIGTKNARGWGGVGVVGPTLFFTREEPAEAPIVLSILDPNDQKVGGVTQHSRAPSPSTQVETLQETGLVNQK